MHMLTPRAVACFSRRSLTGLFALWLFSAFSGSALASASVSQFYDYKVIASTAAGGSFIFFDGYISINDQGNVAFTGGNQQGPGLFFARRNSPNGWLTPETVGQGNLRSVSLNNDNHVATVFQTPDLLT
jgi:hypothetical protein